MNFKIHYLNDKDEEISYEQWRADLKPTVDEYMDLSTSRFGREIFEETVATNFTLEELFFATEEEKQRVWERFREACYAEAAEDKGYIYYMK